MLARRTLRATNDARAKKKACLLKQGWSSDAIMRTIGEQEVRKNGRKALITKVDERGLHELIEGMVAHADGRWETTSPAIYQRWKKRGKPPRKTFKRWRAVHWPAKAMVGRAKVKKVDRTKREAYLLPMRKKTIQWWRRAIIIDGHSIRS